MYVNGDNFIASTGDVSKNADILAEKLEPIAIVGMAARLPQDTTSMDDFWALLRDGRRATSEVPKDRVNMDAFYHPNANRSDTTNVRIGNFLSGDLAAFDAPFFSIKPIEAGSMDPQQRILLETSYQALENAGIPMEQVAGSKAGVFIAASTRDYEVLLNRDPELLPKYMGTGIGTSLLANRVSWFFDWLGPSVTLDTACSGSLTAVHLACQSLRNRESSLALAGGGSLILAPEVSMSQLSSQGFLSPDGLSYSFDSRANGYSRGEGLGVIVLKRIGDAIRDGDNIRAVIRSTAINQDGRTPGITQPSKKAQTDNIKQAYEAAGLNLDDTTYFEAHGTGTAVGDPFEAEAIHAAFRRKPDNPLYIGALKSNIGHLEAGAGIAAMIKSVLILENGVIPPIAGFEKHNPAIPADEWSLKFLKSAIPFPDRNLRRISINSFGYGGTNAHAVLDDALSYLKMRSYVGKYSIIDTSTVLWDGSKSSGKTNGYINGNGFHEEQLEGGFNLPEGTPTVLLFSSSDEAGVKRLAEAYEHHLSKTPRLDPQAETKYLASLAHTLSNKRSNLPWKAFSVVKNLVTSRPTLVESLSKPLRSSTPPSINYIFTGQGAQWHGMARGLAAYPVFAQSLRKSQRYLEDEGCEWILRDELHKSKEESRVNEPELSQSLCTVLQIALVDLLESWQIRPAAVIGHSSGEIAAAYCVGALSHASAIKVAYHRGRNAADVSARRPGQGAMMAVGLSEAAVLPYLKKAIAKTGGRISVGCVNAPENVTVTGDISAIEALRQMMDKAEIFARKLQVSVAYHSTHMEDLSHEYLSSIKGISPKSLKWKQINHAAMFSSVTGSRATLEEVSLPEYWVENLVSKVRFSEALTQLATYSLNKRDITKTGRSILLEIGPHSALQRAIKDTIKQAPETKEFVYETILSNNKEPPLSLAHAMGRLRCHGCPTDLSKVSSLKFQPAELKTLTDLPTYAFNHSQSYWMESRLSKGFRFREYARHELLGVRETDWNPLQPKFRNVIRVSEHPWIHDHTVRGTVLYPAAATLVMAIEGARQLAGPGAEVSGYQLNDVAFPRGFVVPSGFDAIEAQIHFHPHETNSKEVATSHSFQVFAFSNNDWTEVCCGTIAVEVNHAKKTCSSYKIKRVERLGLQDLLKGTSTNRWNKISSSQYYENMASCGYEFGPMFQTLEKLRFTEDGQAAAKLSLDNWTQKVENPQLIAPHVIHPTDLDGILQSGLEAFSQGSHLAVPILIPSKIKSLWISGDMIDRRSNQEISLLAKTTFRGYREVDFVLGAVDDQNQVQVIADGFRQVFLNGQDTNAHERPRRTCYHVDWKPDVDLLSDTETKKICEMAVDPDTVLSSELIDRQELVALFFIQKALKDIPETKIENMPSYLKKYMAWMKHHFNPKRFEALRQSCAENEKLFGDDATREDFFSNFYRQSPDKLLLEVGRNFSQMLTGELDVLESLFGKNNALDEFYSSDVYVPSFARITAYIDLVAHKNPNLNILEVGAGTGSLTGPVLETLTRYTGRSDGNDDISRLQHYTFTDISPGFFVKAKEKFKRYADHMDYSVFNLEKDAKDQGFEPGQFDMVIASVVLHATTNLKRTLENVRYVLKPGGKLIILESCAPDAARASFVFGLLPGWWLSEEKEREWSPLIDSAGWHRYLLEAGFSGVDVSLPDQSDRSRVLFEGLISTAVKPQEPVEERLDSIIVAANGSELQQRVAEATRASLLNDGHVAKIFTPSQFFAERLQGSHCISLLEIDSSFFGDIGEEDWVSFKTAVTDAAITIWTTKGCTASGLKPELAIVKGLGRVIRSENPDTRFVELALEDESSEQQMVSQILKTYRQALPSQVGLLESEFMEQDGNLCIGRVAEATSLNSQIHETISSRLVTQNLFGSDSDRGLKLTVGTAGLLDTLSFDDDILHDQPLKPTEIEIEVKASGVNFKDILIALGRLASNVLGFECAGVVVRAGLESGYQPGDRVCACTITGGFKNYVRTDATAAMKVPKDLSFNAAAGIPLVFATAYYSLGIIANIKRGESILIHSGAGGVGQAAIQIAQRFGARVFTTVGSEEKKELLKRLYDIPGDHIFSSRNTDFAEKIESMTSSGVDVVLNSLTGAGLTASWSCLAPLGRFVELGKADIESSRSGLPMGPFANNVLFHSVSLDVVMDKAKPLIRKIMTAVSTLFQDGNPLTVPQPLHVYPVSKIEEAFRFMQTGRNAGKIVVEMKKNDVVPMLPTLRPRHYFDSNATYVISGGLGGLGRTIVKWMTDRRARHFLLLSRSGASGSDAARDLIEEMKAQGVQIRAPCCDIIDEQMVSAVMEECRRTMPPIKGCIQASMVLRDGILENMSASDLHAVLRPKTLGTVHLHRHMPQPLDFFVLLSSIASMTGTRGQANYSAANNFQDAFARHLAHAGQPCVSLNLGAITNVGFAAERNLTAVLRRDGFEGVSKAELLALLNWACDPKCPAARNPSKAQLVDGLAAAENMPEAQFRDVYWTSKPMFRPLLQLNKAARGARADVAVDAEAQNDFGTQLAGAGDANAAKEVVLAALVDRLARLLALPPHEVDPSRSVPAFGIDSLVGLELRQWLGKELRAETSILDILQSASVEELAAKVAERSELRKQ